MVSNACVHRVFQFYDWARVRRLGCPGCAYVEGDQITAEDPPSMLIDVPVR